MTIKALVIQGDFTPDEFGQFVALMRRIDEASPERVFKIEAFDEDSSLEDAERIMREALKPEPGRETLIASYRRTT